MKIVLNTFAALGTLILLNSCGDEKTVFYPSSAVSEIVDSLDDLKKCTDNNSGTIVYVRNRHKAYVCSLKNWEVYEEYDEPHIGGSDEDESSSSSEKSGGKSSSSQSSKDGSSSGKATSDTDEDSSSSEESVALSSSAVVLSSSSAFVCADDWYCRHVEETCDESTIDSFAVLLYNDKTYYYRCMADGWMPSDLVEYDTFGKPCSSDADTAWGTHDFYDLKDSLNPYRKFYVCRKGSFKTYYSFEESNSTVLTFFDGIVCDDFHQNVVVQKKYSSFACHGTSWFLEDQYTGTMVDDRDGREYKTVGIGDHIWMQENLRYTKDVPAVEYGTYSVKQGPQYNWYTAANVSEKEWNNNPLKIKAPIQGICPDGWHLPTYRNFLELSDAIHGMVDDYYHSNNISSVKNSVKACYVGKNWSLFTNNSFKGKDCMNMKFLTVPRLESNGRVAKNDSNHTTAMWRSDTYDDFYAGSLNLSNAMYNETSMAFNENAYVRMEAFEVIRCVKDEEGEHIYKSPYDIPQ